MNKPNWTIESDYDYVDHLSPSALAFEFLRRNPDYRTDYVAFTAKIELLIIKGAGSNPVILDSGDDA